jgi:hypothetical protein
MEGGPFGIGIPRSSRKRNIEKFGEYMEKVEMWAYETFTGFEW